MRACRWHPRRAPRGGCAGRRMGREAPDPVLKLVWFGLVWFGVGLGLGFGVWNCLGWVGELGGGKARLKCRRLDRTEASMHLIRANYTSKTPLQCGTHVAAGAGVGRLTGLGRVHPVEDGQQRVHLGPLHQLLRHRVGWLCCADGRRKLDGWPFGAW